jgi:alpha-L-fucosidase
MSLHFPAVVILLAGTVLAATRLATQAAEPEPCVIQPGPFQPTMESLKQYKCPEWFRDAKFGIWAHWGPQAVPMDGDWYARGMYEPGNRHYQHHLANYGHPSTNGYKDIIPLWKAEKWDPDRLMGLYKQAGAKYFVSMGTHHDNFHLWNSKLHRWNAVNMGPHRDVVADWQKAAKKYGLRFGVSEHLGASFTWFQSSHGADKTGLMAGVPYDGADPQFQDLYHFPAEPGDKGWYSNNPRWQHEWYSYIKDLVDNYHLDLLYSDGGLPFGNEVGRSLIAHLYNTDLKNHRSSQVVYNCKQKSDGRWVEDLERGVMPGINPDPWQTDTSIGDWYYNQNWKFRPVSWSIHMLVDIVSKNGNLLLNVVQRPDGSLDPEVEQMLHEMAGWNAIHGEAIYGTRPWLVYGEGAVKAKGGNFREDFAYTAKDIRFTTKGKTLYAIALGWPENGRLTIKSLGSSADGKKNQVKEVALLGYKGKLNYTQTAEGLVVTLPDQRPSPYTVGLKITGTDLKPLPVVEVSEPIHADANGTLTLSADTAELHGDQLKQEAQGGQPNIGFWDRANEWVSWKVNFPKPGPYKLSASYAAQSGSEFVVEAAGQEIVGKAPATGDWASFRVVQLDQIEIAQPGPQEVKVRPHNAQSWRALNLRFVKLSPGQ